MAETTIQSDVWRVVVDPERGCGLFAAEVLKGNQWLPVMPDARKESCALSEASFLLVPYSNRIEDGSFVFQDRSFQLDHANRHARHGDVRKRSWTVLEQSEGALTAQFVSKDHQQVNWPWPFKSTAGFKVNGKEFVQTLSLENVSHLPMPAGLGWHPYFNRSLTREGEPVRWAFHVDGIYPDAHDNRIPSGPSEPPSSEFDFSMTRLLRHDMFMDYCANGFKGAARVEWPESDLVLTFDCSSECGHIVVYNPIEHPFFALEPVTNANDGVNLLARGDKTSGIQTLEPGEQLEASFRMLID